MAETQSGNRVKGGVLLFGLALAAILAAVGYRSLSTDSISADDAELGTPLDRLEERVAETPDDGAAWQELGFLRFEQGEYGAAAAAYRKAAEIDPGEAVLWSALGEALVMDSKRDPLATIAPHSTNGCRCWAIRRRVPHGRKTSYAPSNRSGGSTASRSTRMSNGCRPLALPQAYRLANG